MIEAVVLITGLLLIVAGLGSAWIPGGASFARPGISRSPLRAFLFAPIHPTTWYANGAIILGLFVAIIAFLPLPFAGYWLAKEIYAFSQTLGLTMMGGAFSWLFIIQAVLIGNLFLAANYYLWLGMGRVEGRQPVQRVVKYLLIVEMSEAANSDTLHQEVSIDLTDVNQPVSISFPQGCLDVAPPPTVIDPPWLWVMR